jgi:Glucose dehydrogenase
MRTRRPAAPRRWPAAAPSAATGRASIAADATAPEDGQWTRPAKDYASSRYSGLAEINTSNVAQLRPVVTFSTGVLRGQEAAPIIVNNTMYVSRPSPTTSTRSILTKPGAR